MPLYHLIILSVIQGITEFLPISSSGHLALYPALTGAPDQGPAIDVAVHVGSLVAVMLFFRADVASLIRGGLSILSGRLSGAEARMTLLLAAATVPVVICGLIMKLSGADEALRAVAVIAWTTLIGGVLLWLADRFGGVARGAGDWTLRDALLMGLAQAAALVPGTSRSGATMTMARAGLRLGGRGAPLSADGDPDDHRRRRADRPVAGGGGGRRPGADAAIAAFSALSRPISPFGMMMLEGWTMTPFVLYRPALGGALLWFAYA